MLCPLYVKYTLKWNNIKYCDLCSFILLSLCPLLPFSPVYGVCVFPGFILLILSPHLPTFFPVLITSHNKSTFYLHPRKRYSNYLASLLPFCAYLFLVIHTQIACNTYIQMSHFSLEFLKIFSSTVAIS